MPIPAGVIAVWTGTLVNIPAGWNLCDGNGGRPNLLEKFLKGVPDAATNPGATGGSDTHLHVESATGGAHNHGGTSGSGGAHVHTTPTTTGTHDAEHGATNYVVDVNSVGLTDTAGNHNHTWPSGGAHTHPIDTLGAHAHTFQNADTRPAYYQVAFIYSDGTPTTFAQNVIALWSGTLASIPAGFSLDTALVAKFLRGVPAATNPGGTGGADSHTHTQDAAGAHTHTLSSTTHTHTSDSAGNHYHNYTDQCFSGSADGGGYFSQGSHTHGAASGGGHTHTATSAGSHSHTINTADGRPPYYELAPIKAGAGGANLAIGVITTWTGTLANIPANWALCDGNGGRPNLFSKFIRGVNTSVTNPGGTGGATTHTHTPQAAGDHTHTVDSQGTHTHTCNDSTWSHNHGPTAFYHVSGPPCLGITFYGPAHNHGNLSSTGAHTDHSTTTSGTHVDHTYNTASSLPAYYEVAYIYCTSTIQEYTRSAVAALAAVGISNRLASKTRSKTGTFGVAGVSARRLLKLRVDGAAIAAAGTASRLKIAVRSSVGAISTVGVSGRLKAAIRTTTGTIAQIGVSRRVAVAIRSVAGALANVGAANRVKMALRTVTGGISQTGSVARAFVGNRSVIGAIAQVAGTGRMKAAFRAKQATLSQVAIAAFILDEELYVNLYTVTSRNAWTKVGTTPYLDAIDYPINYIHNDTNEDEIGNFDFADSARTTVPQSVLLRIHCRKEVSGGTIKIYIDSGAGFVDAGTITPDVGWADKEFDVSSILDTYEKVNAAKIYLRHVI